MYLYFFFERVGGLPLPITVDDAPTRPLIHLSAGLEQGLGKEGYRLTVREDAIDLKANTTTGVFYAIQSLRQLLPVEIESAQVVDGMTWTISCVTIHDQPRFGWRGHMFDVGRHFFDKATILRTLGMVSSGKFQIEMVEKQADKRPAEPLWKLWIPFAALALGLVLFSAENPPGGDVALSRSLHIPLLSVVSFGVAAWYSIRYWRLRRA